MPTKTDRIDYALYDGDKFIDIGTVGQLSKKYGIAKKSIKWWATKANKKRNKSGKRTVAVKLTDEDW